MVCRQDFSFRRIDLQRLDPRANEGLLVAIDDQQSGIGPAFQEQLEEGQGLIEQIPGAHRADMAEDERACGGTA